MSLPILVWVLGAGDHAVSSSGQTCMLLISLFSSSSNISLGSFSLAALLDVAHERFSSSRPLHPALQSSPKRKGGASNAPSADPQLANQTGELK